MYSRCYKTIEERKYYSIKSNTLRKNHSSIFKRISNGQVFPRISKNVIYRQRNGKTCTNRNNTNAARHIHQGYELRTRKISFDIQYLEMSLNIVKYVNNRKLNNLSFHIEMIRVDTQICDAELFRDPHKYLLEVRVTP